MCVCVCVPYILVFLPLAMCNIDGEDLVKKEKKQKNYAGSKTLPASIKEKEAHWPKVP